MRIAAAALLFLYALLAALVWAVANAYPQEPTAVHAGPWQLLQVLEQRNVYGELDEDKVLRVPFSAVPWGKPGYAVTYTPVMVCEVPGAGVGDLLDVRAFVTVSHRSFIDFRTKKAGALQFPTELTVCDEPPACDGEKHGYRVWAGGGENVSEYRPYYIVHKDGVHVVRKTPVYVCYYAWPESAGAKAGKYVSVPTTSNYNHMLVRHYRRAAPAGPAPADLPR